MSNIQEAYNRWSEQYDTNLNKTRDLEALSLRATLADIDFRSCLEIGCGTGKNTLWLMEKAAHTCSVDLSEAMLAKAKEKIKSDKVRFVQADITQPWHFADGRYDLVSFSLVLEHIGDLDFIFKQVAAVLEKGGYVYIGELHPFKQYTGSKARFETEAGTQVVTCHTHHLSEFVQTAKRYGLQLADADEYFDEGGGQDIPRILTLLLKKV